PGTIRPARPVGLALPPGRSPHPPMEHWYSCCLLGCGAAVSGCRTGVCMCPARRAWRRMGIMNDLSHHAVTRTAKLATLPVGLAGRTALGTGRRLAGRPAELVSREIQQRTAEQVFRVLGELKGGAMKLGQALSIFEAALPPEIAGPYRATLARLQESAPPLP